MTNIAGPGMCCGCSSGQYVLSATGEINNLDFGNSALILFTGSGTTTVDIVSVYGLKAGRPGQLVTILNATLNGVVWLQHMATNALTVRENQLFNNIVSMATPLGSNGTATYQYSGWDARWHLIAHEQGYPIQYGTEWRAIDQPEPSIGDGQLVGIFILRGTMLLTSINMTMGPATTYGGGRWWWTIQAPWSGIIDTVGSGMAIADRIGQAQGLTCTYSAGTSPSPWDGIVAATLSGQAVGSTIPWGWGTTDQLRLTLDLNIR